MKVGAKVETLILGGESRVDLLPPQVRQRRKVQVVRRRMGFAVFMVAILMIGATAFVRAEAQQAKSRLAIEQAYTQSLLLQQRKYVEVRKVQEAVDTIHAAEQIGTSTEINWEQYLTSVQATLPSNVTLGTINIDSETPLQPYAQATAPLQGARIATLSFTAKSSTLPQVPAWLDALMTLPGYSDATPGSVTRDQNGGYSVNITMHINKAAFTNRFGSAVQ